MVSGTGTSKRLAALAGSAGFWGVGFGVSADEEDVDSNEDDFDEAA